MSLQAIAWAHNSIKTYNVHNVGLILIFKQHISASMVSSIVTNSVSFCWLFIKVLVNLNFHSIGCQIFYYFVVTTFRNRSLHTDIFDGFKNNMHGIISNFISIVYLPIIFHSIKCDAFSFQVHNKNFSNTSGVGYCKIIS